MDFFFVKKIIAPFILPPGIFVMLLIIAGVLFIRRRRVKTGLFNMAVAVVIWVASIAPVSDDLSARIEKGQEMPRHPSGDVIILLGGGLYEKAQDLTGTGVPGEDMMYRMVTAMRVQKRLHVPIIVSGGAVAAGRMPEALVVKRFLLDLGVQGDMIILEEKSRDTSENARYSKAICLRYGFRNPLLITSGYHMRRSLLAFQREGVRVMPLPAYLRSGAAPDRLFVDYLPSAAALATTSTVIREYLGLLFYRLGGK